MRVCECIGSFSMHNQIQAQIISSIHVCKLCLIQVLSCLKTMNKKQQQQQKKKQTTQEI